MKVAGLWFSTSAAAPARAPTQKVAEHALRFSPQIAIREGEAVFIEIGKCRRLFSEASFLARMQVVLRRLGLQAQIAIASDIPEALVLAKYKVPSMSGLPLEALLELADPFCRDLVLRKYVSKMISSFADLGVRDIEGFCQIPAQELSSRFGPVGLLCRQRVRREITLPWPAWRPEVVISEKYDFPYFEFYGELEPLLFELKKQLDQIFQRLWARALKVQKLRVRIFCETNSRNPKPYHEFVFDFLFAQSSARTALNVIRERLSRFFEKNPIRTPIEALETTVLDTVPRELTSRRLEEVGAQGQGQHNGLSKEEWREQWQSLLSQLSEAHGTENIFRAELTEDRRPERSWRKTSRAGAGVPTDFVDLAGRVPLRPTYLLRPEAIEVTAGYVHIRKKPFLILHWAETVERISGGWFEASGSFKNSFDRNYYQVELEGGVLISLFQDPDQKYFLHGYFG